MPDKPTSSGGDQARPALRFDGIETEEVRGEQWSGPDTEPDWLDEEDEYDCAIEALPESRVVITLYATARDELPRCVRVRLKARYIIAELGSGPAGDLPEGGNVEDVAQYLADLPTSRFGFIVNRGLTDLTPYLREHIYSVSARLTPESPLIIKGSPRIGRSLMAEMHSEWKSKSESESE